MNKNKNIHFYLNPKNIIQIAMSSIQGNLNPNDDLYVA